MMINDNSIINNINEIQWTMISIIKNWEKLGWMMINSCYGFEGFSFSGFNCKNLPSGSEPNERQSVTFSEAAGAQVI